MLIAPKSRKVSIQNDSSIQKALEILVIAKNLCDITSPVKLELTRTITLLNYAEQYEARLERTYCVKKGILFTFSFKDLEVMKLFKDTVIPEVLHSTMH